MIYLVLSIICSASIYALFKLFGKYRIHTFQAIVANYFVASGFGFAYAAHAGAPVGIRGSETRIPLAFVIGVFFISLFYITALTSQLHGVSVTSIATKMLMVIPALFFFLTDPEEGITLQKSLGIILGIAAVILASIKKNKGEKVKRMWVIPVVLFIGSGVCSRFICLERDNRFYHYMCSLYSQKRQVSIQEYPCRNFAWIGELRKHLFSAAYIGQRNYGSFECYPIK